MWDPKTAQWKQAGLRLKTSGESRDSMLSPPCVIVELRGYSQCHLGKIQRETLSKIVGGCKKMASPNGERLCDLGREGAPGEQDPPGAHAIASGP